MAEQFARTFKDAIGRDWTADLNMVNLEDFEAVAGMPIEKLFPPMGEKNESAYSGLQDAISNPRRMFDLFYVLVKPAADVKGLDKKAVLSGFATDEARDAMYLAVLAAAHRFFSWDHRRQALLKMAATQGRKMGDKAAAKIGAAMDGIDLDAILPSIEPAELTARIREQFSKPATTFAATSE